MNPQITDYLANADRFSAVVAATSDWSGPSPCEGWTAADVLDHVVDSQRNFLAAREVDLGPRPDGAPADVWRDHVTEVRRVVADDDLVTREYDGHFGRTTLADTLASFYGFDMVVHRWDLGRAAGQDVRFSEEEMHALESSIAGFGDALYSEGVCRPPVDVPDEASRQDVILARLGRRP